MEHLLCTGTLGVQGEVPTLPFKRAPVTGKSDHAQVSIVQSGFGGLITLLSVQRKEGPFLLGPQGRLPGGGGRFECMEMRALWQNGQSEQRQGGAQVGSGYSGPEARLPTGVE